MSHTAKTGQAPIDFFFDFSSPYSFLAAHRLDAIAAKHGRVVAWRPVLLGVIFKDTGGAPNTANALKGKYMLRDLKRFARLHNLPFTMPEPFPFSALLPSRAYYWVEATAPDRAHAFARAIFDGSFQKGIDVSKPEAVAQIAHSVGLDGAAALAAVQDDRWKTALREATEDALNRGMFGAPYIVIDGEPFWGNDRLPEIDAWLQSGGW